MGFETKNCKGGAFVILCLTGDCTPLLDPARLQQALAALPPWRQNRLVARSSPEHRAAGAGAWLLVEQGAKKLGIALPSSAPAYTPHGKPYFPDLPRFSFSLSHSGTRCLCIVSDDGQRLGCDLERLRPLPQWERLARRFFHPQEGEWLSRQPQPETAFFRLWCEKEAALKATAAGFSQGMQQFSLRGGTPAGFPQKRDSGIWEGYAYALCWEAGAEKILVEPVEILECI